MENIVIGTPFVPHVNQELNPTIRGAKEEVEHIYKSKVHPQLQNLKNYGKIRVMGYEYDMRPFLKTYLYKQYGQWNEVYAPNKTLLKKSTMGAIDRIIELK